MNPDPGSAPPAVPAQTGGRGAAVALLLAAAVALLSLWLRSGFPLQALGGASIDDALFIRLADSLRRAHWLGSYSNVILAKGMSYPLFIAVTSLLHIPLKIAEQGVYLTAAAGFAFLAFRLSRNRWLGVVLFCVLALNPVLWAASFARVAREGLYIGLSLAVAAAAAALCLQPLAASGRRGRAGLVAAAGILFAAYWLTREEGVWILPTLGMIAAFAVIAIAVDRGRPPGAKRRIALEGATTFAAGLGAALALVTVVAGLNLAVYGVFTDVEFRAHGFLSAYGALTRVKQDDALPFVPVPRAVREKVYSVSPAAAELRPLLEGELGAQWQRDGCASQGIHPCTDILGGWFVWALRDAVAAAGHYRTSGESESFYERMAREIDLGCAAHRLDCLASRIGLRPQFHPRQVVDAVVASPRLAALLFRFGKGEIASAPSDGTQAQLALFRSLAGPVAPRDETAAITNVNGWVAGAQAPPAIAITDAAGNAAGSVDLSPAPDVDRAFAGMFGRRFFIRPQCPADCNIIITTADGAVRQLPLSSLLGAPPADTAYQLNIEFLSQRDGTLPAAVRERLEPIQRIARAIADVYAFAMPALFMTGCLGLVIALGIFRRDPALVFLTGTAVAAGAAVAARVALLSYIDVTSFSTVNTPYLSPAAPFIIIVAVLGNWLGLRAFTALRTRRQLGRNPPEPQE